MEPRETEAFTLKGMFAKRVDPYEGADLAISRRIVGAMLGLSTLLCIAFLAIDPPSEAIGWAGWFVGGAAMVASTLQARRILKGHSQPSWNYLLFLAYAGLAQIGLMEWLAGGGNSAYGVLYMAWLGAGVVHPPRRATAHLGAMLTVSILPLFYATQVSAVGTRIIAGALMLAAVGMILIAYLHMVRQQRSSAAETVKVARRLARVDELTGLGNRRAFDEALTVDVARAEREDAVLSVGLIDIDSFKKINDEFGHLEGDRALQALGRALEESVRISDRCYRWAGDEFAVLLPGATREVALDVLARVADHVAESCKLPDGKPLEISYGSGQLVPAHTPEDLLAMADVELFGMKETKQREIPA